MAILGIESLVYGVDDIPTCSRFWDDFGLIPMSRSDRESIFELPSGSRVIVRARQDCGVTEWFEGNGAKLVVWGVDTEKNLESLVSGLERDGMCAATRMVPHMLSVTTGYHLPCECGTNVRSFPHPIRSMLPPCERLRRLG